jgi:pilus assembly protein Flp/PilA
MTKIESLFLAFFSRVAAGTPVLEREDGQTLAEYAMILALIALVVIGAVVLLGGTISSIFSSVNQGI